MPNAEGAPRMSLRGFALAVLGVLGSVVAFWVLSSPSLMFSVSGRDVMENEVEQGSTTLHFFEPTPSLSPSPSPTPLPSPQSHSMSSTPTPHPTVLPLNVEEWELSEQEEQVAMNSQGEQDVNRNAQRPHIVFLLIDDLGYGTSFMGNKKHENVSPTTMRLAKQGVIFTHMYAHAHCSPSRRAFLSGRLPVHSTGELSGSSKDHLDLRQSWISDKLNAAGYECHMVGKMHTGVASMRHLPTYHGFKDYVGYLMGMNEYVMGQRWENLHPAHRLSDYEDPLEECQTDKCTYQYSSEYFSKFAQRVIERYSNSSSSTTTTSTTSSSSSSSSPLFLLVSFQAAHSPWRPVPGAPSHLTPYVQMLWALDRAIARIEKSLVDTGLWEDTLLVYQSDNGAMQSSEDDVNTPMRGAKSTMFEGGLRVPAFVSGGALPAHVRGTENDMTFHIVDWHPTFSSLAGISPSDNPPARPRPYPLTQPRRTEPFDVWGEHSFPPVDGVDIWDMIVHREKYGIADAHPVLVLDRMAMIVDGRHKLIVSQPAYTHDTRYKWAGTPPTLPTDPALRKYPCKEKHNTKDPFPINPLGVCVFDIRKDPRETKNVAQTNTHLTQNLTAILYSNLKLIRECNDIQPLYPPSTYGTCSPPSLLGKCIDAEEAREKWQKVYPPASKGFMPHLKVPQFPVCSLPDEVLNA